MGTCTVQICVYLNTCGCVHIYVYVHMCIYIHMCAWIRACENACLCLHVHVCFQDCVCAYVLMSVFMWVYALVSICMHVHMCATMYVCTCVCLCICVRAYVGMFVNVCLYPCVCLCVHVYVYMYCIHVHECVCSCVCAPVYVCTCICVWMCTLLGTVSACLQTCLYVHCMYVFAHTWVIELRSSLLICFMSELNSVLFQMERAKSYFISFLLPVLFYVCGYSDCMHDCAPALCSVLTKDRRGPQIPWNRSHSWLYDTCM